MEKNRDTKKKKLTLNYYPKIDARHKFEKLSQQCIFCDKDNYAESLEHIVPESFGNKLYVMEKGKVCDICNGRFSKSEGISLANSIFVMERARFGIVTKKGKNVKGKVNDLKIKGDEKFRKTFINLQGLNKNNFRNYDPKKRTAELIVEAFDKSEVATAKLLLKMGLESMYKSQNKIFNKYDFTDLKSYLTLTNNKDWPLITTSVEIEKFISVPKYYDKFLLKKNHCELKFFEIDKETLLFKFKFGGIAMTINLINRRLSWIPKTLAIDQSAALFPEHYRKKLENFITIGEPIST